MHWNVILLCLELVEGSQEHLPMIHNQDVNLGDVVEVLDLLVSSTVYQLRRSVYFVVLPSVQYRGVSAAF